MLGDTRAVHAHTHSPDDGGDKAETNARVSGTKCTADEREERKEAACG